MPSAKPLALALLAVLALGIASPDALAQKKKKAAPKPPPGPTACTDFHAVANKDWLTANTVIGSGTVSSLGQLRDRARQQQRALLDESMRAPQGNVQKLLGDFWASGLDEAAIERDGANPIAPLLSRINGIKRAKDIPPSIAALHQVGIPVAFNFSADVDLTQLDRHIGYFGQGGIGLPDPAYYTRTDAPTQAIYAEYAAYVRKILTLTGTTPANLEAETALVLDLEKRIAQASRPASLLRDPRNNFAPVATADLAKTYKRLQLGDFLKAQGVTDDRVSLAQPELFAALDGMVANLKPEQWKAYLRYQVGSTMAPYLAKSFRDADDAFHGRVLRGQLQPQARTESVLDAINQAAGPMLAREYVARHLPAANRSRAEAIANEVRASLVKAVDANTWMAPATRAEAKAKLAKLTIEIGAPRRDLDYSVQPMGRGSFGGNMLIASTWRHREEMKRIGRGNADRRWDVLPQEPSLAYDIAQNRLIVSAAVLQPPVLDMAQDAASHYGSYGALVAHELGRAIDTKGRVIDAAGTVRTWWTAPDEAAWQERTNRLSAQYGNYAYPGVSGARVNGSLTADENAADLVAVEIAWDAFATAQPAAEKPAREAFFRGWATLWQQQASPDVAARQLASSPNAPGQWRVNGPLVNLPAFGDTYGCKAGTAMRAADDAQVRIWR